MNKSNNIAKRLDTFFKWVSRILIILMVLCVPILIISIIIFKIDPNFSKEIMNSLEFGNLTLFVSQEAIPSTNFAVTYTSVMLVFFLLCFTVFYIALRLIRNILNPIIKEQPFHSTISINLKKLGWINIIFGIISGVFSIVENLVLYNGYNLGKILTSEYITKIIPQFTFDLDFIFVSAFIFLLSYIFKYGAELQQQVDETL